MAGDSLRELRFALPAVAGVAPVTWYKDPVEEYDHDTAGRGREQVNVLRNTVNRASYTARKGETDKLKIVKHRDYAASLYYHASLWGLPTTSNHGAAGGVKDHDFLDNDSDQPIWFRFLNSIGWWEAPDYIANQVQYKQDNQARMMEDWDFQGKKAYPISVQTMTFTGGPAGGSTVLTIPAIAGRNPAIAAQSPTAVLFNETAAALKTKLEALTRVGAGGVDVTRTGAGTVGSPYVYVILFRERTTPIGLMTFVDSWTGGTTPATTITSTAFETAFPLSESWANYEQNNWAQFLGKIDGVATDFKSFQLTVNRERKPEFNGRRTTDPAYFTKPDIKITGSVLPDYKLSGDLNSLFERFRNGDVAPKLEFDYVTPDSIGSGTPTVPHFLLTVYKATSLTGKQDLKAIPTTTPITFRSEYSSADGQSLHTLFTDEITAVTPS